MTQQYLVGEVSLRLAQLQAVVLEPSLARAVAQLRREAEASPPGALPAVLIRTFERSLFTPTVLIRGSDVNVDAMFAQAGIVRTDTVGELVPLPATLPPGLQMRAGVAASTSARSSGSCSPSARSLRICHRSSKDLDPLRVTAARVIVIGARIQVKDVGPAPSLIGRSQS